MAIIIDDEELERQIIEVAAARNQSVRDYVIEVLRASLPPEIALKSGISSGEEADLT